MKFELTGFFYFGDACRVTGFVLGQIIDSMAGIPRVSTAEKKKVKGICSDARLFSCTFPA